MISRETRRNLTIFQIFDDKTKELTAYSLQSEYKTSLFEEKRSDWCKPIASQNQCIKRYSRALQWMPRRISPMKDVEDCDKLRVAVNKL